MESCLTNELVENKNQILNPIDIVLSEIDDLITENLEIVNGIHDYKNILDNIISSSHNEFANLSQLEIDNKLENILDEVLATNETVTNETVSDESTINKIAVDNQQFNVENTQTDNKDKIKILNELSTGLNDTFMNILNMMPKDLMSNNNKSGLNNDDSDCSTINPDDLDTESESESDLNEIETSKSKNNIFDPSMLFKSMENLNINDMFSNLPNMSNFPDIANFPDMGNLPDMANFPDMANLEKMNPQLGNISEMFKQVNFNDIFKMMGEMNNVKTNLDSNLNESIDNSIVDEDDELSSFIINDTTNNSSSDTESYDKTDDEEDNDENEDSDNDEEDNDNDKDEEDSDKDEKSGGMFSNLNLMNKLLNKKAGLNFDMSILTNMFNLFGTNKPKENIISKSESSGEDNLENFIKNDNCQTDSDVDYDERRENNSDSDSDSDSNSDSNSNSVSNPELSTCLDENKKMIDNISLMMNKLGMPMVDIKDLANKKRTDDNN